MIYALKILFLILDLNLIEDDQIHAKSSQSGTIYYYDETADKLYQSFEELATSE